MTDHDVDPRVLESIDAGKRSSLRKLIVGTAFAVPAIASFSMDGLSLNAAHADVYAPNS